MKFIIDIIRGVFIGVANIIPGVSGGTMAVSMGVYDKLIGAINGLLKQFKKSFLTLLPLGIGMVGGIGVFSFIIPYCLSHFSLQTCLCFVGLIAGGIPAIIGSTKNAMKKEGIGFKPLHVIAFVILLAAGVALALANPSSTGADDLTINALTIIELLVFGIISAATMVIPGVSGSMILMMLGFYSAIIGNISNFFTAIKAGDTGAILHCMAILCTFAVGCIIGVFLISKLITFLFNKFESFTYCAILGLIAASPFAILYKMENPVYDAVSIIVGVVLLIGSAAFTYFFGKKFGTENK